MEVPNASFSPVWNLLIFAKRIEEFALSRTCDVADLVQHATIKVWSLLFVEAGELWPHDTSVSGFVDGDGWSIRHRSETTRIQPEEVVLG
ncbi:hypothetical protein YC2023_041334 [Brassica napus]